jgi:zinc protease
MLARTSLCFCGTDVLSWWAMPRSRSATPLLPQLETRLFTLGNGLELLVHEDWSAPVASIQAWVRTGSIHEGQHLGSGISHLLEHMVFKGTKEKHKEVAKEISDHGAQFNGTTWLDRTNYFETFASTDENLDWALDMEADRMINSRIAKSELETEMTKYLINKI